MDAADALAPLREAFTLNEGEIYLDGNSLGPVSASVRRRVNEVMDGEWGKRTRAKLERRRLDGRADAARGPHRATDRRSTW